ncbi:MAG: hypothetical protein WEA58_03765 [Balneolaceae bacterium]
MMRLTDLLFNKNSKDINKERALNAIKQNLAEYYYKNISFIECLSKTAPMTADLIMKYGTEGEAPKSTYDTILIIATNYYAMLHVDTYSGFYAINREYTFKQVTELVEGALKEIDENDGFQAHNFKNVLHTSHDFSKQMIEVYYRVGTEGCHKFVVSSIYSVLLSVNRKHSLGRQQIENTVRTIQVEKFFADNHHNDTSGIDQN